MSAAVEREPHTYYPPEQKAHVLALLRENGGNILRVSESTGIAHSTIRYWIENEDRYSELRQRKIGDLASKHENNLHRLADNITDTDLDTIPFRDKVTAIGILTDKMQLLRNQPTSITETIDRQEIQVVLQAALTESLGQVIDVNPEQSTG